MGGEEVIEVLEKSEEPLCRSELLTILGNGWSATRLTHVLTRLLNSREIKFEVIDRIEAHKRNSKIKRKVRVYYI